MRGRAHTLLYFLGFGERTERDLVQSFRRAAQDNIGRRPAQRSHKAVHAAPVEVGVAPVEKIDRLEMVAGDALDRFLFERLALGCLAERAIVSEAPGAACDLRQFIGPQIASLPSVEFA